MKKLFGEYDLSGVQSINWGVVNEAEGIKAFVKATGLTDNDNVVPHIISGKDMGSHE